MAKVGTPEHRNLLRNFEKELTRHRTYHDSLRQTWDKLDRAYAAIVGDVPTKSRRGHQWESRLFPPYVAQTIDILVSNIIDDRIEGEVNPTKSGFVKGAEAHNCLLNEQLEKDRFQQGYILFALQCLVRGISVAKCVWEQNWEEAWFERTDLANDTNGKYEKEWLCVKDQGTFLPVDIRDLVWDSGATTVKDIKVVWHTVYETMENIEELAKPGPNGEEPLYYNVEDIKKRTNSSQGNRLAGSPDLDFLDRVKLVERWTKDRLTVLANDKIIIRDEPNPYTHGRIPFVFATSQPKLFRVEGRSVTEFIKDIQWMLWDFQNQKLDNARLMNNAVVLIRDSVNDPAKFQAFPGAKWPVMNPQDVKFWEPNPTILEQGVMIESSLKDDMNNLSGAVAILAGIQGQQLDNNTATGINIASSGAQRRLLRMKQQILFGVEDAFNLFIKMNQQLISLPTQVRISKEYGGQDYITVDPATLVGEFEYKIRSASESFNKQQKRAEALSFGQFIISNGPMVQQASQGAVEIDYLETMHHVLKTFDVDPNKFVKKAANPMMNMMQQMQQQANANGNTPPTMPAPVAA